MSAPRATSNPAMKAVRSPSDLFLSALTRGFKWAISEVLFCGGFCLGRNRVHRGILLVRAWMGRDPPGCLLNEQIAQHFGIAIGTNLPKGGDCIQQGLARNILLA